MGDIVHININGLKCKRSQTYKGKCDTISSILENINSTCILNIQETHLFNESEIPQIFNLYEHTFHIISTYGKVEDPAAGITLCVKKTMEVIVCEILEDGRLLYIKIKNTSNNEVYHVFSLYGNSGNYGKINLLITKLKNKMLLDNLSSEKTLIIGDFNFVTNILDRNSQILNRTDIESTKTWEEIESDFNLQETFRLLNPHKRIYSFTSRTNKAIKSRIDRMYVSQVLCGKITSITYRYTNISDHKMLRMKISSNIDRGPGLWIFNNTLLEDTLYNNGIDNIIRESQSLRQNFESNMDFWDYFKQNIISFSKIFSKEKYQREQKEINELNKELESMEKLPMHSLNQNILDKIDVINGQIKDHQKKRLQGALLRSKLPNFEENDPSISFISKLEKRKGEENTIYCLKDEETNSLKTSTDEIMDIINKFYKKLYTKEDEDTNIQDEFLEQLETRISLIDKENCERPLTDEELYESLCEMNDNKSPGPDGLTKEWFLHYWGKIKDPFICSMQETVLKKELTEMQKRGAIKISYKKGERILMKNYRPISLLNTDLKIITKALSKRLTSALPKLIHPNQTCIPGRHIETNIHLIQDLIDHANMNNRNLAIIFLDQEKAFDRMSHTFILKTLKKFGFGVYFIDWVETLFRDIRSFVKVNGYETYEFVIERGVRQGCPLSALIYALAAEVLSNFIRKNKKIKGYRYKMKNLQPLEHKIGQYADDTETCITDMPSLEELFKTLGKYQKATNAKINKDKTEGLWVGNWKNRQDNPLNLKWTSSNVKFLGIYIGNKVGSNGTKLLSDLNFSDHIETIKLKINFWKGKGISITTRVKVLNIFILSRLWYRTKIWDISKDILHGLNKMIRDFIWHDRQGARVRQDVIQLEYGKGGLQLVDIVSKTQVQRIQRIMYLMSLDEDNIERFLADSLVGNCHSHRQQGLSYGLFNNTLRIRNIKNMFYKKALQTINKLNLKLDPGQMETILKEPLFYNNYFKDNDNICFKLSRFKNDLPKTVKELQNFPHSREVFINNTVRDLRLCISRLTFSGEEETKYLINDENISKNIKTMAFKELYLILLKRKDVEREWEARWEHYLLTPIIGWTNIWNLTQNNMNTPYVKSALWEMLHLNFWSNYRANETCKLCRNVENDITHILNACPIILHLLREFNIDQIFDNKTKITFGVSGQILKNYLLFQIRTNIFRSRFKEFNSIEACKIKLYRRCKASITHDLKSKFILAKRKHKMEEFSTNYIVNNDNLVQIDDNGDLILNFDN